MSLRAVATIRGSAAGSNRIAHGVIRGFEIVWAWLARRRDRALLASFDDRLLRDIGLTRADVEQEYRKPFWRS